MNKDESYMKLFREAMAIMDDIERELDAMDARLASAEYFAAH